MTFPGKRVDVQNPKHQLQPDEGAAQDYKGRLSSAVIISRQPVVPAMPMKRPTFQSGATQKPKDKKGAARLLGGLLVGTLQKFQEEQRQLCESSAEQRKAQTLIKVDQRIADAKMLARDRIYSTKQQHRLKMYRQMQYTWLKTTAKPKLLWCPKKHTPLTRQILSQGNTNQVNLGNAAKMGNALNLVQGHQHSSSYQEQLLTEKVLQQAPEQGEIDPQGNQWPNQEVVTIKEEPIEVDIQGDATYLAFPNNVSQQVE